MKFLPERTTQESKSNDTRLLDFTIFSSNIRFRQNYLKQNTTLFRHYNNYFFNENRFCLMASSFWEKCVFHEDDYFLFVHKFLAFIIEGQPRLGWTCFGFRIAHLFLYVRRQMTVSAILSQKF